VTPDLPGRLRVTALAALDSLPSLCAVAAITGAIAAAAERAHWSTVGDLLVLLGRYDPEMAMLVRDQLTAGGIDATPHHEEAEWINSQPER
jgi:hypothetical protein